MAKNERDPKHVKRLIAEAEARLAKQRREQPTATNVIPAKSLWNVFRRRRSK